MADERLSTAIWERAGRVSLEIGRLDRVGDHHRLSGTAIYRGRGGPVELRYRVETDEKWRAREVDLDLDEPAGPARLELRGDGAGAWWRDGKPLELAFPCDDVDLAFTPATNTLSIRRLALEKGQSETARVLWVPVPSFAARAAEQTYTRLDARTYKFAGSVGAYKITVDRNGWVLDYPGGGWAAAVHKGPKYR